MTAQDFMNWIGENVFYVVYGFDSKEVELTKKQMTYPADMRLDLLFPTIDFQRLSPEEAWEMLRYSITYLEHLPATDKTAYWPQRVHYPWRIPALIDAPLSTYIEYRANRSAK